MAGGPRSRSTDLGMYDASRAVDAESSFAASVMFRAYAALGLGSSQNFGPDRKLRRSPPVHPFAHSNSPSTAMN